MAPAVMASQVASGIGMIAGAWMFKAMMEAQEAKTVVGAVPRCPTCNGSKRVPCICKRWSDGDEGCATCNRTGMRPCSSCGDLEPAAPSPVKLRISNGQKKF